MITSTIEPELNSLLTKLSAEIESDEREIDIRQKRIKKNETLLRAVRGSLGVANPAGAENGYGRQAEIVRTAIHQMTEPLFTQKDIEAEIRLSNPDVIINSERIKAVLWSLQKKKKLIKQVRQGNNRGQIAMFEKLPVMPNGASSPPPRSSILPRRPTPIEL